MSHQIEVQAKFTLEEFKRAWIRKDSFFVVLTPIVFLLLELWYLIPNLQNQLRGSNLVGQIIALVLVAGFFFGGIYLMIFQYRIKPKKEFEKQRHLREGSIYRFDNTGLVWQFENENGNLQWRHLFRLKEVKGYYCFFLNRTQAFFVPIPKKKETDKDLRDIFIKCLGKKAKLRKR